MNWSFEPARVEGRPIEGIFVGAVRFQLRPDEEDAIAQVVRDAFETWIGTPVGESLDKARRVEIGGKPITPTSVLEERLTESFEAARGDAESLSVDAIQFVDEDAAWATTTLRLRRDRDTGELPDAPGSRAETLVWRLLRNARRRLPAVRQRTDSDLQAPGPRLPPKARDNLVRGDVILQVAVELDGSTTVVRVVKSVPYCNVAAIENARKWRWMPAVKDGAPVRAVGIITVSFDIVRRQ